MGDSRSAQVDRYVRGQLTGSELEEFEQAFFEDPELFEEVELAAAMASGLRANQHSLGTPAARPVVRRPLLEFLTSPAWSLGATAAAVALAATLVIGPSRQRADLQLSTDPADWVIYSSATLDASGLRSTSASPKPIGQLPIPASYDGLVRLTLILPRVPAAYSGELLTVRLSRTAVSDKAIDLLVLPDDGLAEVVLPSARLSAGVYRIAVNDAAGGEVLRSEIEVLVEQPDE